MREAKIFTLLFLGIYSAYTVAVNFEVIAMSIVPQEENQMMLTQMYQDDEQSEDSVTKIIPLQALQTSRFVWLFQNQLWLLYQMLQ